MARTHRRRRTEDDDDDSPLTPDGVLKDGRRVRVSMMDAMNSRQHLHDGKGGTPGRRNGFAFSSDAYAKDELAVAYSEYEDHLRQAYKGVADVEGYAEGSEGGVCQVRGDAYPDFFGAPGHIRRVNGELVCVPDSKAASGEDHASTMDQIYSAYDQSLETAYKDARKTTRRDPQGREEGTWEEEDDDDENDNRSRDDDDNQMDDQRDEANSTYDAELRDAWRKP